MVRTSRWHDSSGQVSFAVVAVVLLVASSLTGTYLAKRQLDEMNAGEREELMDAMEEAIGKVSQELSLLGASQAQAIVSKWDSFPVNESEISSAFDHRMFERISSLYPRDDGRFNLEVTNWSGGLFFIEQKTLDLVPSDKTEETNLAIDGCTMDLSELPSPSTEVLGERTTNPYYVAIGNFSVSASEGSVEFFKESSFERPIISALPFLEAKLRTFESSSDGEFSDLARMVSYMLTTLCEMRVLEGYGQPMYTSLQTADILTEEDAYRAVSVGLLLEQARLFRGMDRSFERQVANACGGGEVGVLALSSSFPRYLDPAELFLWFLGKTSPAIDGKCLVAQAVYGLADQLCLKLLDYMGWLGGLDSLGDFIDRIDQTIDLVMSAVTGEDKAKESVVEWIEKAASNGGSSSIGPMFSGASDFSVPVAERQYFVENATGDLFPVWVGNITAVIDLPTYDMFSSSEWRDFYPQFKSAQRSASSLVHDSVMRLAYELASLANFSLRGISIDPADGKDLFCALSESHGAVTMSLDMDMLVEAASKLPMFSAEYELAQALNDFVLRRDLELVDRPALQDAALDKLVPDVVASARYPYIPNLVTPVDQQVCSQVAADLESDPSWAGATATSLVDAICHQRLLQIAAIVNASVVAFDGGYAGHMVDSVAAMLVLGSSEFPGLKRLIEDGLTGFVGGVLSQERMSAFKSSVLIDLTSPFEFWEGDRGAAQSRGGVMTETIDVAVPHGLPAMQVISYDEGSGCDSLDDMFPTEGLMVMVKRPWQFDRGRSEYPNLHMTSIANITATPYTTQWTVSVLGAIEIETSSRNPAFQALLSDSHPRSASNVRVALSFPVVLHSSWPLMGVEYNPSSTVASDLLAAAKRFIDGVWKKLEPAVGWLKDGLERLYRFVTDAFSTLASYATKVIRAVASALQTLVETLQSYVQKIVDSVVGKAVRAFLDMAGRVEFRISLFGFVVIVQTNLPDLIYRHGTDMLRIIFCTSRLGPGIAVGLRVARMTDGSLDIVANGTLTMRSLKVDVRVDPLMKVMRRFVELHCAAKSWALDLTIPEVEPYDLAEVSTSDLPGVGAFLSNIPIPVLGLSASVEAGLKLKYASPFPSDIVINEFESNPLGEDAGGEWVELYNPFGTPRCVDGWSVVTLHGESVSLELEGTIAPNGLLAFTFPGVAIDNGDPGDPFNDGDSLVLLDPSGATVDSTPTLSDSYNDDRSWQRNWDGGPKWVFEQSSKGGSNGLPVVLTTSDFIAKALFEAFKQAFVETQLQEVSASLDFIVEFTKRVLENFIENMLALVGEIVHEVILFIEVRVSDATGSAGIGFRTSFVVGGEAVVDLLRWLVHSLATFIVNLGRASNPVAFPSFPDGFFAGLSLRFELLFEVGLPKMMRVIGVSGEAGQSLCCAVVVSPNIPALGKIVGRSWGNWSIDFGVCMPGLPKEFASSFLLKDTSDLVDFWIVKARLYGV